MCFLSSIRANLHFLCKMSVSSFLVKQRAATLVVNGDARLCVVDSTTGIVWGILDLCLLCDVYSVMWRYKSCGNKVREQLHRLVKYLLMCSCSCLFSFCDFSLCLL